MAGKVVDVTLRLIDNVSSPLRSVGSSLTTHATQWVRAGRQIENVGKKIEKVGSSLTKTLTVPIVALGTAAVENFGEVDKSLKLIEQTMGETKWMAADLEDAIKKAASNSVFTMQEASDATLNFARQGFDAKEAAEMLTPALNLAAATGTDLSEVTSGLGNTLKVFSDQGLTATDASNIFAQAQAQANTNVTELFDAMSVGSSIFNTVGWSMQDLAAITGVFGDNFISGSEGATAMKTGLARLTSPTDDAAKCIEELGLSFYDSNGNMKSMIEVQEQLHNSFAGLTQEQQMAAASALFGKNQMAKWLTLINTAPSQIQEYRNALDGLSGTSQGMADALLSGVGGSIEKLKSTFDVFKYSVGEALSEPIQKFIDSLTTLLDKFNNLSSEQQKNIVKWAAMAAAVGPAVMIFGRMTRVVGSCVGAVGRFGRYIPTFNRHLSAAGGILRGMNWMPAGASSFGSFITRIGAKLSVLGTPFRLLASGITTLGGRFSFLLGPIRTILNPFQKFYGLIAKFGGGYLSMMFAPLKHLGGIFGGVGKALFTVLGPANTVVVVLAALVAAGVLVYKNWDKIKEAAGRVFNYVKNVFTSLGVTGESMTKTFEPVVGKFNEIRDKAVELWTVISPVLAKIGDVVFMVFKIYIGQAIGAAIGWFHSMVGTVTTVVGGIMTALGGIIDFLTGVFTGNWSQAWNGIKSIFSGVFQSLVGLAKAPINAVIGIINGAFAGINNLQIKIPDWVPGLGGQTFAANIPLIPTLATGTDNWKGGIVQISERGGEIVDLPSGSRVYPHDESVRKAYGDGASSGRGSVTIAKIADQIIVREEADIDKIAAKIAEKLDNISQNMGGGELGYIY